MTRSLQFKWGHWSELYLIQYNQFPYKNLGSLLVFLDCWKNILETEWFKLHKFISSQFCNLEVQDQGAIRVGIWWALLCRLGDSHYSLCPPVAFLLCSCRAKQIFLYSLSFQSYPILTPMISSNFDYLLFRAFLQIHSQHELELQHMNWWLREHN